jgi:hypothetical protein
MMQSRGELCEELETVGQPRHVARWITALVLRLTRATAAA